jgi:cell wall-associated NlpC family hydrolase
VSTSGHYSAPLSRWIPAIQKVKRVIPALTARQLVVKWARWGVAHTGDIHYTETVARAGWLRNPRTDGQLPLNTDCSGFATFCYRQAGLPDPNGLGYKELGYTGTLLQYAEHHGRIITDVSQAKPGDLIVYGPGTGWHVAVIVQAGRDPLTVSHGQESEPSYVRVSQDGRQPQRVCRYLNG